MATFKTYDENDDVMNEFLRDRFTFDECFEYDDDGSGEREIDDDDVDDLIEIERDEYRRNVLDDELRRFNRRRT